MKIRFATEEDLPGIVKIYNQAIRAGNATGDQQEFSVDEKKNWFRDHSPDQYPIYVMEVNDEMIGWGSLSPYRKGREAFSDTAEITYYIDYDHHGVGFGAYLLKYMLDECATLGIKNVLALLLEINKPSIAMLKNFGFIEWGSLPDVAKLSIGRCAHLIYGKMITDQ